MSLAGLRALFDGGPVATSAARVELHDGATGPNGHYYVNSEGDIIVTVRLHHHDVPIDANLSALVGGRGAGVWCIPDVGTEVIVAYDEGDMEGEAYIVGAFGAPPNGLAPGKVLVVGLEIEARSADGTALKLPTLADVQDLVNTFNTHTHPDPASGFTGTPGDVGGPTVATDPSGTLVFKAQ